MLSIFRFQLRQNIHSKISSTIPTLLSSAYDSLESQLWPEPITTNYADKEFGRVSCANSFRFQHSYI